MERYYEVLRLAVEEHGGTVVKLLGDGVMAAFGVPQVAEDDAIRAVRAGVAMQEAFSLLAGEQGGALAEVGLRIAVNTGEVVVSGDNDDVVGDPVNVAARLQEEADNGDVVVGEATRRLVSSLVTLEQLGSFELKGRSGAVEAYRVVSLERPAGTSATPFVGREAELARITAVYETAVGEPAARLAVLVGSPGLGKSRLMEEVGRRFGEDAAVINASCDAAGGATFAPLADALREYLDIGDAVSGDDLSAAIEAQISEGDSDRARIAKGVASLLAGAPGSPEETFFVVRRLLAAFAADKPLLLAIDDVQWAEPLLLDLVEHLVQWGAGVPLLLLAGARPELRDLRSSLVTPEGLVSDVVTLDGLDAGAATRLAAQVIGASDLPAAVAAKVLATSEGNPLFVGELVRMLVHEGILTREDDRWIVGEGLASFEMPPTIHALLAARIERLQPEDRTILEHAAVVGRQFSRNAVAELLPNGAGDLDARLEALRRTELIERDAGWFLGEPVLRFHHVLIRDAAYRRLLKETRAELHTRFADWIEGQAGDSVEHDETIGWHLEQAHQLLGELGPLDESGLELGGRAAERLSAAGRRALARDDVSLAANLLQRALVCLDKADPTRADLALDGCEALLAAGEVALAGGVIDELEGFAESSERLQAWHTCFVGQLTALTAPEELRATADAVAGAAEQLAKLGDTAGEAKAHFVHAQALARLGKVGACEAALDRALAAARSAGDRRRANAVLAGAPLAALWGPSPVTRASGRCLDVVRVLRITQGAPAVESVALSCQGVLEALRGRTDAARRMIASSRKMVEELGISHRLFEADVFAARIDLLEGDAVAAERGLRGAYEGLRDLGLGIDAARAAALLARTLLSEDRAAEAEDLSHESEALAGDDLQAAIAWRGVRAEALAQRGEIDDAIELAQAAVEIAASTDALLDHADARLALAAALRAAGRTEEANAEEHGAHKLWETKGATLLAERARKDAAGAMAEPDAAARAAEPTAPVTRPAGVVGAHRRVRPNVATAAFGHVAAAVQSRDVAALEAAFPDDQKVVEHAMGRSFGKRANLATWKAAFEVERLDFRRETVATLGERLSLELTTTSVEGLAALELDDAIAAFGPSVVTDACVIEADDQHRLRHADVFPAERLADAVVRLFERHAELRPDGAERERASATAQAVAGMLTLSPHLQIDDVMGPDVEIVDHRRVGYGGLLTRDKADEWGHATEELSEDRQIRVDAVLALTPDALLRRTTESGKLRSTGGDFENSFCSLSIFGPDGKVARQELYDGNAEATALARFDELAGASAPAASTQAQRRVRPNAATRSLERFGSVINGRDEEALSRTFDESLHVTHHPSQATYGRREMLGTWRSILTAEHMEFRSEILASLGNTLALERHSLVLEGLVEAHVADFGRTDFDEIALIETDEEGAWTHCEIFDAEQLLKAISRFYERYAERLADGPERVRTMAASCAVAAMIDVSDVERWATAFDPAVEAVDHRLLGSWSASGARAARAHMESLLALASEVRFRTDDILALTSELFLARVMHSGMTQAGGGGYERPFLLLSVFGSDGLVARQDYFDVGREAEALARLDGLTGTLAEPVPMHRRVRPNAASDAMLRLASVLNARDLDAVERMHSELLETIEHDYVVSYGRGGQLDVAERMMRVPEFDIRIEPLATLGENAALVRRIATGSGKTGGNFDVGDYELEHLVVCELDEAGKFVRNELFASDRLSEALVRLYERYAELLLDGSEQERAATMAQAIRAMQDALATDSLDPSIGRDIELVDHRVLGTWNARGRDAVLEQFQSLREVADDIVLRDEDVVAQHPNALLTRRTHCGTERRSGGTYERPFFMLLEFEPAGHLRRIEWFDVGQEAQALARFDELVGGVDAEASMPDDGTRFENAAAKLETRLIESVLARDWTALAECFDPAFRFSDRRPMSQIELGREGYVEFARALGEMSRVRIARDVLATRGERLVLYRARVAVSDGDVGPSEIEHLNIAELNERGDGLVATVRFDSDDLESAYIELEARYTAGEAEKYPLAVAYVLEWQRAFDERDWDAMAKLGAADQVARNHRLVGWGTIEGENAWVRPMQELVALAGDVRIRADHLRLSERGVLVQITWWGTQDGGAFETTILLTGELDEDGRHRRMDIWDADRVDEAVARFEEIRSQAPRSASLLENVATRYNKRAEEAWVARDWDAFRALHSATLDNDDRRRIVGMRVSADDAFASLRILFDVPQSKATMAAIATRGDRLALSRVLVEGNVDPEGGDLAIDYLIVDEVDADGISVAMVSFEPDDFEAAYAELHARWQAGEAKRHPLALTWLAESERIFASGGDTTSPLPLTPDVVARSHRLLSWGTLRGVEAVSATITSQFELAPDTRQRIEHARTCERGLLWESTWYGTRDGGPFETARITVVELDSRGAAIRIDVWDPEQCDQALARFEQIAADSPAEPSLATRFENAATRVLQRGLELFGSQDWDEFTADFAADFESIDRTSIAHLESGREDYLPAFRQMFDLTGSTPPHEVLATRGDRLALARMLWRGAAGDVGPSETEWLFVFETDEREDVRAIAAFDPGDLDAAYDELEARWEAGEAAAHEAVLAATRAFSEAFEKRDWDDWSAVLAPECVRHDHRTLGLATTRGVAALRESLEAVVDLAPDARYRRPDHVRIAGRASMSDGAIVGTRDGGPFEIPGLSVVELDDRDKFRRMDFYDPERYGDALARFEEIVAGGSPANTAAQRFANAASRAFTEGLEKGFLAHDWEQHQRIQSSLRRYRDHRALYQLDLDREKFFEFTRPLLEMRDTRGLLELLATRGERFALMRMTLEVSDETVGPSATDSLMLVEVDDDGRIILYDRYDEEQVDDARAELRARNDAADAKEQWRPAGSSTAFLDAMNARDWDAIRAICAPDFGIDDHRQLGFGGLWLGVETLVESQKALVELSPDARYRLDHVRVSQLASLSYTVRTGTREGGLHETISVNVNRWDESGKLTGYDIYDPEQLDEALARYEELSRGTSLDTIASTTEPTSADGAHSLTSLAKPTSATAQTERALAAFQVGLESGDWDSVREVCAPGMAYEDRRRMALLSGDVELMIASLGERASAGASFESSLLSTAGDRVGLLRWLWAGGPADGRFEIEYIAMTEVDEAGQLATVILFDLDDARAAQQEAWDRWAAVDPIAKPWITVASTSTDAFNDRNMDRLRPMLTEDFVIVDHRRTGFGRIEGREAWFDAVAVLWDLSPDTQAQIGQYWLAIAPNVALTTIRRSGNVVDGGAFESEYLILYVMSDGLVTRMESFELDALDDALARFEELRGDAAGESLESIIAPNAAARTIERLGATLGAEDFDAARELSSPDLHWEDRQPWAGVAGDRELMIASARERFAAGARPERFDLIGTAGDRVCISRVLWAGGPPDGRFENEFLVVTEVDEAGLCTASIFFDVSDRLGALREAWDRWARIDPAAKPSIDLQSKANEAFNSYDLDVLRERWAVDLVVHDHRRTGLGMVHGREAYCESLSALWKLSPDTRFEVGWYWPAWNQHVSIVACRRTGTVPDGGPYETDWLTLGVMDGGVVTRLEFFEIEDLDLALARFEELRPDPLRIPPNSAVRATTLWCEIVEAGDPEAVATLSHPSQIVEDRRPLFRTTTGADGEVINAQWVIEGGWRPARTLLATAGDRLVLQNWLWTTGEGDARSETEVLELDEIDEEGRFVRTILFDPDDRAAAAAELRHRWLAIGGDGAPAAVNQYLDAWCDHDLDRLRTLLHEEFYLDDRRRTGVGRVNGEQFIASLEALFELSSDVKLELLYPMAIEPYGLLGVARWYGTNAEGGAFESVFLALPLYDRDRCLALEQFEIDDVDAALARFEELRPDPHTGPLRRG